MTMTNPTSSTNQRSHPRYTLKLPATMTSINISHQSVEIYDFCVEGMYLLFKGASVPAPPITQGEVINISFRLPESDESKKHLFFQAKVIRASQESLGVTFLRSEKQDLQRILNYALHLQSQSVTVPQRGIKHSAEENLATIIALTEDKLKNIVDTYLLKQNHNLIDLAQQALNITLQNNYFNALSLFDTSGETGLNFKHNFLVSISKMLHRKPGQIATPVISLDDLSSSDSLSLVENSDLDKWIIRSDISNKIESKCHEILVKVELQLSQLFGITISTNNNPFGPEAFTNVYLSTIKNMPLSKESHHACSKIFGDTLAENITTLYSEINKHLMDEGYLPDTSYKIKKTDQREPKEATGIVHTENKVHESKELYNLISSLQSLRKEKSPEISASIPSYSTDELLEKLSSINFDELNKNSTNEATHTQHSISLQILNDIQNEIGGKPIPLHEASIIESTGSIYNEIFQDKLITSGVKEWLREIELPLLNEALQDDSVLYNPNHLARQFINKIAQLEHYNDNNKNTLHGSVRQTIEELLQQLSQQKNLDPQVIHSLLKKVDALLKVQDHAYHDNLQDAISTCQAKTELPPLPLHTLTSQLHQVDDEQLKEWRKLIRRLKLGDWLLFDADSDNAARLRLAWVSEGCNDYAFVNLKGQIQGHITADELAIRLSLGSAMVLDNANESALDRAQYGMLQKLHKHLIHETTHDSLTGLINRREFEKWLSHLRDTQSEAKNVICYYNLDYFDVINNSFGFEFGDQLLTEVAKIFNEVLANRGQLARVGGNEFALLLSHSNVDEASLITDQLRTALRDYHFVYEGARCTISFGAAIVPIDLQRHEAPRLLQTAEAACRLAKGKGVDQQHIIQVDDLEMKKNEQVLYWASRIDESLDSNELTLRYQPIVPIFDDELQPHAEILLGINDQHGQLISPQHFILAAERYRRMPEIDRWVVKNVLHYFKKNPDILQQLGGVAINLSGLSINDEKTIPFILEQLELSQLPTSHICFEVTETAGIENLSNAAKFITEIKQSGVTFSLDDFGTGMSTYAYLKNLPVDYIKIDGSFVRDIASNQGDRAVVKSITEIGHFMGKKIIAECVEDATCLDILKEIGVDYAQGYAIKRPQPLSDA